MSNGDVRYTAIPTPNAAACAAATVEVREQIAHLTDVRSSLVRCEAEPTNT